MSNDIRTDPEVLRVYWEMKGQSPIRHATYKTASKTTECSYCGRIEGTLTSGNMWCEEPCPKNNYPRPITMSTGDLAFWMMDQCNYKVFRDKLYNEVGPRDSGSYTDGYLKATPEQWIRAACKAWDSRAAQRRE